MPTSITPQQLQQRITHGRYLTRDLVLSYHRALAAGDTTSDIAESTIG